MKIWHLFFELDKYDYLTTISNKDWEALNFDGSSKINTWVPISVKVTGGKNIPNATSISPGIPVLDLKAVEVLKDLLGNNTEVLPLKCKKGEFFAINICDVLDCINYEKSQYEKYDNSDRIMVFEKYEFFQDCLEDVNIFKIIDEPERRAFVSDKFRERVLESKLTGFRFDLLWDSSKR